MFFFSSLLFPRIIIPRAITISLSFISTSNFLARLIPRFLWLDSQLSCYSVHPFLLSSNSPLMIISFFIPYCSNQATLHCRSYTFSSILYLVSLLIYSLFLRSDPAFSEFLLWSPLGYQFFPILHPTLDPFPFSAELLYYSYSRSCKYDKVRRVVEVHRRCRIFHSCAS